MSDDTSRCPDRAIAVDSDVYRIGVLPSALARAISGADGLYLAMGWVTSYVTESWHKDIPVG